MEKSAPVAFLIFCTYVVVPHWRLWVSLRASASVWVHPIVVVLSLALCHWSKVWGVCWECCYSECAWRVQGNNALVCGWGLRGLSLSVPCVSVWLPRHCWWMSWSFLICWSMCWQSLLWWCSSLSGYTYRSSCTCGRIYLRWICWMRCMLGWDSSWMNEIQSFLTGRWCLGSSACIRWVSRVCMLWILNFHSPNDSRKSCPIFCKLFVLVLFWLALMSSMLSVSIPSTSKSSSVRPCLFICCSFSLFSFSFCSFLLAAFFALQVVRCLEMLPCWILHQRQSSVVYLIEDMMWSMCAFDKCLWTVTRCFLKVLLQTNYLLSGQMGQFGLLPFSNLDLFA